MLLFIVCDSDDMYGHAILQLYGLSRFRYCIGAYQLDDHGLTVNSRPRTPTAHFNTIKILKKIILKIT